MFYPWKDNDHYNENPQTGWGMSGPEDPEGHEESLTTMFLGLAPLEILPVYSFR